MTSRRGFLAGLASSAILPSVSWSAAGNPVALSAVKTPDSVYALVGLTADGGIAFRVPLPDRGHAAAAHPTQAEAVAIARRPGTFAKVIDCMTGQMRGTLTAPAGRHFYGHGAFSADGKLLFTPENDVNTGVGRIGVWDRTLDYARIDEFSSGGIGPHEILRLPSGHLAVANGGIKTHPATGRDKLNLDTMQSNLSVFSVSGVLMDQAEVSVADRLNSLRHIAAAPDGTIVCGLQWQGDPFDAPQLVSLYKGNGKLVETSLQDDLLRKMNGYIGSVCAIGQNMFAASSPRGGRVATLGALGQQMHSHRAPDVCGLASLADGAALVTDGFGQVYRLTATDLTQLARHPLAFDNHLVSLVT